MQSEGRGTNAIGVRDRSHGGERIALLLVEDARKR